jgi:hypothetical protein
MTKKYRSAITGRYVPESKAKKSPNTTVAEKDKPKSTKKK